MVAPAGVRFGSPIGIETRVHRYGHIADGFWREKHETVISVRLIPSSRVATHRYWTWYLHLPDGLRGPYRSYLTFPHGTQLDDQGIEVGPLEDVSVEEEDRYDFGVDDLFASLAEHGRIRPFGTDDVGPGDEQLEDELESDESDPEEPAPEEIAPGDAEPADAVAPMPHFIELKEEPPSEPYVVAPPAEDEMTIPEIFDTTSMAELLAAEQFLLDLPEWDGPHLQEQDLQEEPWRAPTPTSSLRSLGGYVGDEERSVDSDASVGFWSMEDRASDEDWEPTESQGSCPPGYST